MGAIPFSSVLPRKHDGVYDPNAIKYSFVKTFITFQLLGGVLLILLVATAVFSKRVTRQSTWYSFCISWIISVTSYTLLTLSGQQYTQPGPHFGACLAQTALIYPAPPLTASTTLAVVIQLWLSLRALLSSPASPHNNLKINIALVVLPYVVAIGMFIVSIIEGLKNQNLVQRANSGVYCIINTALVPHIAAIVTVILMIVMLVFEGLIARLLWKHWNQLRGHSAGANKILPLIWRIAVFTLFGLISLAIGVIMLSKFDTPVPNIFLSLIPVVCGLVFGSQLDILQSWMFWRRPSGVETAPPVPSKTVEDGYYLSIQSR